MQGLLFIPYIERSKAQYFSSPKMYMPLPKKIRKSNKRPGLVVLECRDRLFGSCVHASSIPFGLLW
jgi:hypothetical protein